MTEDRTHDTGEPDDELRALLGGPIEPLRPEPGHFDSIVVRARRRRARGLVGSAAAVLLVAAAGIGLTLLRPGGSDSVNAPFANKPTSTSTSSPSPTASQPSNQTSAQAAVPTTGVPAPEATSGLPAGGGVPAGFRPTSVTSVSGAVLYALGTAPCATAPCTSVVRSTDGGARWIGVPAPKAELAEPAAAAGTSSSANEVRGLRFGTPRDGWAFGGALYATHDGAATWRRSKGIGGPVLDLATDGTTVYAVVAGPGSGSTGFRGARLMSSPVGTDDWKPVAGVSTPGRVDAAGIAVTGGRAVALFRSSAGGGASVHVLADGRWSVVSAAGSGCGADGIARASTVSADGAAIITTCHSAGGSAASVWLATSADGGASWRRQDLGARSGVTGSDVVAAATPTLLAAAPVGAKATGAPVRIRISRDGGASWTDAGASSATGWSDLGAGGPAIFRAASGKDGHVVTGSTDGGRSWRPHTFG